MRVVDDDAVRDEAVRARHLEVIRGLLPFEDKIARLRPCDWRIGQGMERGRSKTICHGCERVAPDPVLALILEHEPVCEAQITAPMIKTLVTLQDGFAQWLAIERGGNDIHRPPRAKVRESVVRPDKVLERPLLGTDE